MKQSQKKIVLDILKRDGVIDNVWAFNNYILRLGAIVFELRREGYVIRTEYKNEKGLKNTHYYLEGEDVSRGDGFQKGVLHKNPIKKAKTQDSNLFR